MPEVVITPTSEPSINELRRMLDAGEEPAAAPAAPPKTEAAPVAPAGEKTPAVEPEPPAASEPPKEPKPEESAIDRRFSKLARQRDEARQRESEALAEAERLRRELEARTAQPGPAAPKAPAQASPDGRPQPPDPTTWTGTYEDLQAAQLDYVDKLTDWKLEQAEVKRRTTEEQRTVQGGWEERAQQALKEDPEFLEAIREVGEAVTAAGVSKIVMESEVGPELVKRLYNDDAEFTRIMRLGNPVAIARELGKIEAQILSGKTTPTPKPAAAPQALPKTPASVDSNAAPADLNLDTVPMSVFKKEIKKYL